MNATNKAQTERMSIADIEAELSQIKEAEHSDALTYDRRDFKTEIEKADAQQAEEIRAEQTLYSGRKRRRAARRHELENTLTALKAADVSLELKTICEAHENALVLTKAALENINLDALTTLEQQINDYLSAESNVRNQATKAAVTAKNAGVTPTEIQSVYSNKLSEVYERLERLKRKISSSSQRASIDQTHFGVPFGAI